MKVYTCTRIESESELWHTAQREQQSNRARVGVLSARAMRAVGRPALSVGETNTKSAPKRGEESKSEHVSANLGFLCPSFLFIRVAYNDIIRDMLIN